MTQNRIGGIATTKENVAELRGLRRAEGKGGLAAAFSLK